MAIGRTFPESLQKALRSLEQGRAGMNCDPAEAQYESMSDEELLRRCGVARARAASVADPARQRGGAR